jgi:hypothetical protein
MSVHILGVRHHGCGSARSVRAALGELRPDIVLLEGPPEANEVLPLAAHADMRPPVALLLYAPEDSQRAAFYPFVEFSPEWQAILYALGAGKPCCFIDLPQSHQLTPETEAAPDESKIQNLKSNISRDPLQFAAETAGFSDGEIWWESLIETRQNPTEIFGGVLELMTAVREEAENAGETEDLRTLQREAFMRQEIRRAQSEGYQKIAVICGAWHAPKLGEGFTEKADAALLKGLPKTKLDVTWIPYTHSRLTFANGYGAGVQSPEFYRQLWHTPRNITAFWLSRVAQLLREQGLDASSASVIESVRLAESLAAMRGLAAVGLAELFDAVRAVFCFGNEAQIQLIQEKLIVGERLGEVPAETPTVPLQRDLQAAQKRLRFPPEATQKVVELDLRKANDLEKSQLLHRLKLIGIKWGTPERSYGKGTFKESWRVQWQPEFALKVIEASLYGNTVETAATNFTREQAAATDELDALTALVEDVLLAGLPAAVEALLARLQEVSAVTSDVAKMMDALLPLADVLRYSDVRKTATETVGQIVNGLVTRICVGLPNACAALNDDSADEMYGRVGRVDNTVSLLQDDSHTHAWQTALQRLASQKDLHGLVAGRAARLLFERQLLDAAEVEKRVNLAVSVAAEPAKAAAWIEGFLRGSGLLLLYHETLLSVLDSWLASLNEEIFVQLLPILRRTFSTFEAPERRKIGERLKGGTTVSATTRTETEIDEARAGKVMPLLEMILGERI